MTQQHHDRDESQGIPLSAVYRQLDDHPAADAAGYDPAATVARLMTRWASSDPDTQQGKDAAPQATEPAPAVLSIRQEVILQMSRRRLHNAVWAYAAILGITGAAAAVAAVAVLATHLPVMTLVGLAVTAVLVTQAVVLIHRATMHGMTADYDLLVGREATVGKQAESLAMREEQYSRAQWPTPSDAAEGGDHTDDEGEDAPPEIRPRLRMPRFRIFGTEVAAGFVVIAFAVLHTGTAGLIAVTSIAGAGVLAALTLTAVALFAGENRSRRVFLLLEILLRGGTATSKSHRARLR